MTHMSIKFSPDVCSGRTHPDPTKWMFRLDATHPNWGKSGRKKSPEKPKTRDPKYF